MNILFVLTKTPEFYGGGPGHNYLPGEQVEKWRQFVRNTVEKYRESIKHWNIWNEPNLTQFWDDSPENFIDRVLKPAFETIKSVDPEAKICGPELSSTNGNASAKQWLRKITESGVRFDILTHHQYDGGDKLGGDLRK